MRKLVVAVVALSVLGAIAWPATAGRGGGRVRATITFAGDGARVADYVLSPGDSVSFAVDPVGIKDRDLYELWVANKCTQQGELTYVQYLPVAYSAYRVGVAGPFSLGSAEWSAAAASCTAYVWKFPASEDPLAGSTLGYEVSG